MGGIAKHEFHVSFVEIIENTVFARGLFFIFVKQFIGFLEVPHVDGCLEISRSLVPGGASGEEENEKNN